VTGWRRLLALMVVPACAGWLPSAADTAPRAGRVFTVPAPLAALHQHAVDGDAQAQFDLGILLLCGRELPRDAAHAALWMAMAAARNHDGAQSVLGWQLMTATGVRRDDLHAAHWIELAARAGDTAAQNNLGVLYALGQGVPRDPAEAERWFRAAADQGAAEAQRNLALLRGSALPARSASASGTPGLHPALIAAGCTH
jgi:TPR repeat protein